MPFNLDLPAFITAIGHLGVFAIIFAESGLFIGFFLPGDSLLFTAGLLASKGYLNLALLVGGSVVSAILGDSVGYAFGRRVGPKIFSREDSILFHKKHIKRTKKFYEKHGAKTIILARFMPIVRTFAPILAGVGEMRYRTFITYNVMGGALWAAGVPMLGYTLGQTIPGIDRYLIPIVLVIIFLSVLPPILEIIRERSKGVHEKSKNV
ncbi:hypothetical protein A3I40_00260 [Candidatus Uhrbacteria bacterium RIFCSPLOWO2_02_FULL_48_12]|uniref:VTT domain-containing protein n=1 Tax=Candidatus Uhrbacteria bacterium RIFCSPLOWO2_02_FULL_48_12 TaxID=1802407 RepID=A0A1F7V7Y3_9BACT|nr:MAG: hypothetical protein A3I40_00260 [Candidatus Uhrbacteria bacterium RIFCSPLOWO2_02_FULL_48_12]